MINQVYMQGPHPLKALKCIISIAASHKRTFSIMHIHVSRAHFHAKVQRLVLVRLQVEDRVGRRCWENWTVEQKHVWYTGRCEQWCHWQEHVKKWGFRLGLSSKNLSYQERHQVSGMTHGDDFVITGPTARLKEFESKMRGVYPVKAKIHHSRITRKHPSTRQKVALGKARNCVSLRSQTR